MLSTKLQALLDSAHTPKGRKDPFHYDRADVVDEAAEWLKAKWRIEKIEANLAKLRGIIITAVEPWRENMVATQGEHHPTVIIGTPVGKVRVTFQSRFGKIDASKAAAIRAELGESFDRFFGESVSLKLRKEIVADQSKLTKVITKLQLAFGSEFARVFECERTLVPTKEFGEAAPLDAEARAEFGISQVVVMAEAK